MKNINKLFLGVSMVILPQIAFAQSIVTDFDKKVIMTDSLNLPQNESVKTLMTLLPELLQRPGDYVLSNYDIQINDMSVSSACDVALSQLQIVDVEKIEISESPISSYNNNGQGGSINIILRNSGKDGASTWGSIGGSIESPLDFAPQFNIGHKTKKFTFHGMVLEELFNNTSDLESIVFNGGQYSTCNVTSTDERFRTHLARAYMQYNLTDKDIFKWNVSHVYLYDRDYITAGHNNVGVSEIVERKTDLRTSINYLHKFSRSSLETEVQYLFTPGKNISETFGTRMNHFRYRNHNFSGKIEYVANLLPASQSPSFLKFTTGSNFNRSINTQTLGTTEYESEVGNYTEMVPDNKTWYVMPYANFEGQFGKFRFKAVGEFQHYSYRISLGESPVNVVSNDFTGKIMTVWNFHPHKKIRLTLDRRLERPSAEYLYPYRVFHPIIGGYVQGNKNLKPMLSHEIGIDYIADYKWNGDHSLVLNAGTNYNIINDIITPYTEDGSSNDANGLGLSQSYRTYKNSGKSNILNANLMALYSYKMFSLSFTGNIFHKHARIDGSSDHYTYYNLSLFPHFNLKDGWYGGAKFIYYSKVKQSDQTLSDCALTQMSVGKSWNNLFVYLYQSVALHKYATDISYVGGQRSMVRNYEMVRNTVGLGVKYTF